MLKLLTHILSISLACFLISCGGDTKPASNSLESKSPSISSVEMALTLLAEGEQNERIMAAIYMSGESPTDEIITGLARAVYDNYPEVKITAINALGEFGSQAKKAIPAIIDATKEDDRIIRLDALRNLSYIGANEEVAIQAVISLLDHNDWKTRSMSAKYLVRMGETAKIAMPKLKGISANDPYYDRNENSYTVRVTAKMTLAKWEGGSGFLELLNDSDHKARAYAAKEIHFYPETTGIVTALISALDDESSDVRKNACLSLSIIGKNALKAIPRLEELRENDENPDVRVFASSAVVNINRKANE